MVLSTNAIHNLYTTTDRIQAISEIARVLRPGDPLMIVDIRHSRHSRQDAAALHAGGCTEVRRRSGLLLSLAFAIKTVGPLRPATLLGRKSTATT